MKSEQLVELKKKIQTLSEEEKKQRDLYLRGIALGEIDGPMTGYSSIDKPWLQYYDEEAIMADLPSVSCYDYLYECNKNYLGRVALSYFGRKITFEEMFRNIDNVCNSLKKMGVKKGDIITISLPNIPEAVYLFYACSKLGVIANMVDPRTSKEGIENYIREAETKFVFIIDSYFDKLSSIINDDLIETIIPVSPAYSLPKTLELGYKVKSFVERIREHTKKIVYNGKTMSWDSFMSSGKDVPVKFESDIPYESNTPVVIEHTGGTTGVPKGVLLSNENINAVAIQSIMTKIDMQREHNWLDIMPTFIAYGVAMGLHLPLVIGMETILIPQFDPKKFDELLVKHKPIHMVGVPSYWGTIINSKKLAKKDLSYIIAPTVGGDAMDTTLEQNSNEFLRQHNCSYPITKGYGMTEVAGGVTGTVDANSEIGSVGSPFVKTVVAIFDPETNEELGYNQNGEICITGPNTMLGYFKNEAATQDILRQHADGTVWVHSGDIGYINERGSLFVIDRLKRMIIRYDGFKVFPSIIENVISSHYDFFYENF